MNGFFQRLKQRKLVQWAIAYVAAAFALLQGIDIIAQQFGWPESVRRGITLALVVGFFVTLVLAWYHGERGAQRVSGTELLLIGLVLALGGGLLWRFASSSRVATEIPNETKTLPAVTIPEKSIAVLPFENLSDNKENAFFADGVQDEILTDLAKVADLKVISRTSVMQYRSAAARNLREIGLQLGVAHVLEGSVQRAANTVRVNAQLIDARNDAHLWANTYDRNLADVFAIQSEIAETIAEQLRAQLSPTEKAAIAQAPTKDVVANDLYVRARALDDLANNPGAKQYLLQGISLLEEAVRRDPKFALAYCLMCETQLDLYWYGFDHTAARLQLGLAALQAAERLQPEAGDVRLQRGIYAYHGFRDYAKARTEFELARQTLPNNARLYNILAAVDRRQGRWEEALSSYERAIELDPRNFVIAEEAGFTYLGAGQMDKAENRLKLSVELSPKDYFARVALAQLPYFSRGDLRPLHEQLNKFREEGNEATSNAAETFVTCALAERDKKAAEQALTYVSEEGVVNDVQNFLIPRGWFVGLVARTFGENERAQQAFAAARSIEAKVVEDQPDYAPAWSMLGLLDAGLGHKAEAIQEGRRACELLPLSKDAWEGPCYIFNLAIIYAWLGEKDLAFEQLAACPKNFAAVTYGELKSDPYWDSLRNDPRFQKLLASLAPK